MSHRVFCQVGARLTSIEHTRHLGLEDTHIMLVAMKHHLKTLRANGQGPWEFDGKPGVGGKHCKKYPHSKDDPVF